MARRAGGTVIISRLKQRATPEDSPLIHTVVLQARTSLAGDMKHTHTHEHTHAGDSQDYPQAREHTHILTHTRMHIWANNTPCSFNITAHKIQRDSHEHADSHTHATYECTHTLVHMVELINQISCFN